MVTDNHNYNVPDEGTVDWHEPLNENWESLEIDVAIWDTEAARSGYTPHGGTGYVETDTGALYVGTGSSWTHIGTIGDGGAGDSLWSEIDATTITPSGDYDHVEIDGELTTGGRIRTDDGQLLVYTAEGRSIIESDRTEDATRGNYWLTTTAGTGIHLPIILRTHAVNTLIAEEGDVSIPNGVLDLGAGIDGLSGNSTLVDVEGDNLTVDGNGVLNASTGSGGDLEEHSTTHEHGGTDELGGLTHKATIGLTVDDPQVDLVDRPLMTDAETETWYVSPGGTDSAAGTQADPLSLEGALRKIPYFQNNDLTIDLYTVPESENALPAVYSHDRNAYRPCVINHTHGTARFTLLGNDTDASDVQIDKAFTMSAWGLQDHTEVRGIQFNQSVQFNGVMRIVNCNLYQRGQAGTAGQIVGSKAGILNFNGCTIGEGNVGKSISAWGNTNIYIAQCDFNTDTTEPYVIDPGRGGRVQFGSGVTFASLGGKGNLNLTDEELGAIAMSGQRNLLVNGDGRLVLNASTSSKVWSDPDDFSTDTLDVAETASIGGLASFGDGLDLPQLSGTGTAVDLPSDNKISVFDDWHTVYATNTSNGWRVRDNITLGGDVIRAHEGSGEVDIPGGVLNLEVGLSGAVVDRAEPIDNLTGNQYIAEDGVDPDPTQNDGDVVFWV